MARVNFKMYVNPEYAIYKMIAYYLRAQYPDVLFHFDSSGLHHTKTQAGMLKAIQKGKGFPDLMILAPRGKYHGLFLEIKTDGARIYKKDLLPADEHIADQEAWIASLRAEGYEADFARGFDEAKMKIDQYLNLAG
jgi:hypothetical protein